MPSLHALFDLLFSAWGLLTTTPVVALGVVGAVMLLRHRRAEALVLLAVPAVGRCTTWRCSSRRSEGSDYRAT